MQLLKIRYYQLRRDLGVWTIIIAAIVFFVVREITAEKSLVALYLSAFIVFTLHQNYLGRKDLVFAKTYFENTNRQIAVNYNLLVLPCTLALLSTGNFLPALLIHLLVSIFPLLNYKTSGPRFLFIGRIIPGSQFEWISGLRKNSFTILILVFLIIVLSPVKLFGVAALFLLNLTFIGFYSGFEPRIMLNPHHLSINSFIDQKTRFLFLAILITNTPFLLVNTLFHPEVLSINVAFLSGFLLLAANAVLIKYANYQPNESLSFSGDFLILITSIFIPYLIPVGIMLYFMNRKKARNNLLQFIDHDQN